MISFFGASVTQQKNGYAVKLKSRLANEKVTIFGYGGMHLNNAGVIYIDKVLKKKPSYCFVDWFSTEYTEISDTTLEYINTIIYKFTEAKCKLIFLFFVSTEYEKKKDFYLFCKQYLSANGISYIDLNDDLQPTTEILRDTVHTTQTGSERYADIILEKFNTKEITYPATQINKTKYCDIKELVVNRVYNTSVKLTGNAHILGFLLAIGKHSGIVEIWEQNQKKTEINTWDRWCYFYREHFNFEFDVSGNSEVIITNKSFDTSSCKMTKYDFSRFEKKLIVRSIYYIGESLQIEESFYVKSVSKLKYFKYVVRKDNLKNQLKLVVKKIAGKVFKKRFTDRSD